MSDFIKPEPEQSHMADILWILSNMASIELLRLTEALPDQTLLGFPGFPLLEDDSGFFPELVDLGCPHGNVLPEHLDDVLHEAHAVVIGFSQGALRESVEPIIPYYAATPLPLPLPLPIAAKKAARTTPETISPVNPSRDQTTSIKTQIIDLISPVLVQHPTSTHSYMLLVL